MFFQVFFFFQYVIPMFFLFLFFPHVFSTVFPSFPILSHVFFYVFPNLSYFFPMFFMFFHTLRCLRISIAERFLLPQLVEPHGLPGAVGPRLSPAEFRLCHGAVEPGGSGKSMENPWEIDGFLSLGREIHWVQSWNM